jgi:RNA polymerase primary sigma factor
MDAPLVEGEDSNLYDVLRSGESPNPQRTNPRIITYWNRTFIRNIDSREADVVRLYFGLGDQHPMTLEIGETFDLTRECTRQIKEKLLEDKHTSEVKY